MTTPILIGVVVIILIVALYFKLKQNEPPPTWSQADASSYVAGKINGMGDSKDDNVVILGRKTSQLGCEYACDAEPWCNAYTWFEPTGSSDIEINHLDNSCYGLKNVPEKTTAPKRLSGYRLNQQ